MVKVGINGFGRIGRCVLRAAIDKKADVEFVGINDLTTPEMLAHLLKYDSVHGVWHGHDVKAEEGAIVIDGKKIAITAEKDPANLPWKSVGAEIVLESTGLFLDKEKAAKHISAGAKKVIISAPAKNEDLTIVLGVNEDKYDPKNHHVVSNASCTTNCLAPAVKAVMDQFGVKRGLMTTIHAYTNDQRILDLPHKDPRRARAAAMSMIPTTTGAAKAIALVIPELKGKMDGFAMRVPTPNVSVVDVVLETEKDMTVESVNAAIKAAADKSPYLNYTDLPLVSKDYNGDPASSTVDGKCTYVIGGNLVKIVTWYDNEWGYSNRCVDLMELMAKKGL